MVVTCTCDTTTGRAGCAMHSPAPEGVVTFTPPPSGWLPTSTFTCPGPWCPCEKCRAARQVNSEQPTPKPNNNPRVIDAAIELLESRRELGRERYGTPLQTGNGRDFGRDADEEMADWLIYWTGYRLEHADRIRGLLITIGKLGEENKALRAKLAKTEGGE